MTVYEIKKIIDESEWGPGRYGIRIQEPEFEIGHMNHVSKVWIDNEETEEELNGVCAIDIDAPEANRAILGQGYFGNHIALIGGYEYEYGMEPGEIIFRDPEVFYIIR